MSVILGILVSSVLFYLFTWTTPNFNFGEIGESFQSFGNLGFSVFNGASWSIAFDGVTFGGIFSVIMLIITFCLVDRFDTIGTLYGTCAQAKMLDANGDPLDIEKCMLCDSIATCAGAIVGTSTVTTYVESASGVAEGGRTGLTALTTAILFALCLFLTPLATIIPGVATAPALIYVGVLMLRNFKAIDMDDLSSAVPAFLTLILMPLTYSISNGIAVGAVAYVLIRLFTGKYTKKDIVVTIIAILFCLRFAFVNTL
jgi:AGZA family xanthine/uracil permease-like MFS transporter